jgi:hypothetical protein
MADGNITVEVSTQAAQAELERLRAENARLAREAHTWWTALAGAIAEIEQWRRSAERCVTAWTVVRGGVWDPNGLMDEHMTALRKVLGPNDQFSGGPDGPSRTTGRP